MCSKESHTELTWVVELQQFTPKPDPQQAKSFFRISLLCLIPNVSETTLLSSNKIIQITLKKKK